MEDVVLESPREYVPNWWYKLTRWFYHTHQLTVFYIADAAVIIRFRFILPYKHVFCYCDTYLNQVLLGHPSLPRTPMVPVVLSHLDVHKVREVPAKHHSAVTHTSNRRSQILSINAASCSTIHLSSVILSHWNIDLSFLKHNCLSASLIRLRQRRRSQQQ